MTPGEGEGRQAKNRKRELYITLYVKLTHVLLCLS